MKRKRSLCFNGFSSKFECHGYHSLEYSRHNSSKDNHHKNICSLRDNEIRLLIRKCDVVMSKPGLSPTDLCGVQFVPRQGNNVFCREHAAAAVRSPIQPACNTHHIRSSSLFTVNSDASTVVNTNRSKRQINYDENKQINRYK